MPQRILITGGAGFLGSHLAGELLRHGYDVAALDCLVPQVHGENPERPAHLPAGVELIRGDLRDPEAVSRALEGVDAVYHFAARVGSGQSMYQIAGYTETNNEGTAVLLEALIDHPVERLVVASSMSIYGEGLYRDADGALVAGTDRSIAQLKTRDWDLRDRRGRLLTPVPTPETKAPNVASVYALSKYDQERMCLIVGRAYGLPTVALRFFNVYGPHQALANPYTGALGAFAVQLLSDEVPVLFEDGRQQRDFVHVADVARACRLALETPAAGGQTFNIGSGRPVAVRDLVTRLAQALGKSSLEPILSGQYRAGDVRHCFADITLAQRTLGYSPQKLLDDGLAELAGWLGERIALNPRGAVVRRQPAA